MSRVHSLFASLLLIAGQHAQSETAVESARGKLETCLFCHRVAEGMAAVPVLDGQPSRYLLNQIAMFQSDKRQPSELWYRPPGSHANRPEIKQPNLVPDDVVAELANIFAARPAVPFPGRLDAQRGERGQAVAEMQTCQRCHGPELHGEDLIPRLAGQNPQYTEMQLKGMRAGKREHPPDSGVITLTDQDVLDLSHYFATRK